MENYLNQSESALRRTKRDRQLTELFCEIYDNLKLKQVPKPWEVALTLALATGSPSYHVGFDRAYAVVPQLLHDNNNVTFKNTNTRLMWLEITEKVKCLMEDGKMSAAHAIPIVLEKCRASRFFLSRSHAMKIIRRQLHSMNLLRHYNLAV
jgi:hypothetical protein